MDIRARARARVYVCVCVCVCEREREREREVGWGWGLPTLPFQFFIPLAVIKQMSSNPPPLLRIVICILDSRIFPDDHQ